MNRAAFVLGIMLPLSVVSCVDTSPTEVDTEAPAAFGVAGARVVLMHPPNVPSGMKEGVNLPTDVPFPQYVLDFAVINRPSIDLPLEPGRPADLYLADRGIHTIPSESRLNSLEAAYGTVDRRTAILGPTLGIEAQSAFSAASSSATLGDTIYLDFSSWIDPDPSLWIYFGSYSQSSHAISYINVAGYTYVDQNPWASQFQQSYGGFGAGVSIGYPYFTYGGVFFEQVGDHYAAHPPWEAGGQTYVAWINF